ncbi:FemAB family XrtA/PEP-CTERM system-associated protein [Thermodesulfobacteriota bacterium]
MIIRQANHIDKELWDSYVTSKNDATPYHLFAWKNSIEESYGHRTAYLIAEENDTVKGVLPIVSLKFPFIINVYSCLPFCDLGGVLAESQDIKRELLDAGLVLARQRHARIFEVRSPSDDFLICKELSIPFEEYTDKVNMMLKLPSSSEELWNGFKSKLRSQIRKSEKNGLSFSWGSGEDINAFYSVFSRNMRELGSPVHSKKFVKAIIDNYGESSRMGLVYKDNIPIGAGIILYTPAQICIPWASTLRGYNRLAPNMLLYWNLIKYGADNGFDQFDLGRSTPNQGTYKFKVQWGAQPQPLYWYSFCLKKKAHQKINSGPSRKRELVEKIWQKLPLSAANFFGPMVRKYISL